jgi:hypothetical protein
VVERLGFYAATSIYSVQAGDGPHLCNASSTCDGSFGRGLRKPAEDGGTHVEILDRDCVQIAEHNADRTCLHRHCKTIRSVDPFAHFATHLTCGLGILTPKFAG